MGAARQTRPSEKTLSYIWAKLPHLMICVFHPLIHEAIDDAVDIIGKLGKLVDQLEEEENQKVGKTMKEPGEPK